MDPMFKAWMWLQNRVYKLILSNISCHVTYRYHKVKSTSSDLCSDPLNWPERVVWAAAQQRDGTSRGRSLEPEWPSSPEPAAGWRTGRSRWHTPGATCDIINIQVSWLCGRQVTLTGEQWPVRASYYIVFTDLGPEYRSTWGSAPSCRQNINNL